MKNGGMRKYKVSEKPVVARNPWTFMRENLVPSTTQAN